MSTATRSTPSSAKLIRAGTLAIAHLTVNRTVLPNGTSTSTTRTGHAAAVGAAAACGGWPVLPATIAGWRRQSSCASA